MSTLFLEADFSGKIEKSGYINQEYRDSIVNIIGALMHIGGFSVFCAEKQAGWQTSDLPTLAGAAKEIKRRDIFLALLKEMPPDEISPKMAYAVDAGKCVVAAARSGLELGDECQELAELGHIEQVPYKNPDDLAFKVKSLVTKMN